MQTRALTLALLLLAPAAQAERLFVSNEKDNTITVIDGGTLAVTHTIKVGPGARRAGAGDQPVLVA